MLHVAFFSWATQAFNHSLPLSTQRQNRLGWKMLPRPSSPTCDPSPPCDPAQSTEYHIQAFLGQSRDKGERETQQEEGLSLVHLHGRAFPVNLSKLSQSQAITQQQFQQDPLRKGLAEQSICYFQCNESFQEKSVGGGIRKLPV